MEQTREKYSGLLKSFNRHFGLYAKVITYAVFIPSVALLFYMTLQLTAVQKRYFIPIIAVVVALALFSAKIMHARILRGIKIYLENLDNGYQYSEEELASARKNFARIPFMLAIDNSIRWGIGLMLVAVGLSCLGSLTISTQVTFWMVGFSTSFMGFIIYFVVSGHALKKFIAPVIFGSLKSESFILSGKISTSLSVIIVVTILFLTSSITTLVYNLSLNSLKESYQNQMTNLVSVINESMSRSLAGLMSSAELIGRNPEVIRAFDTGQFNQPLQLLESAAGQNPSIEFAFLASAGADGTIRQATLSAYIGKNCRIDSAAFDAAVAGKPSVGHGIINEQGGKNSILVLAPVKKGDLVIGIIGFAADSAKMSESVIGNVVIGTKGYPFILDSNYKIIGIPGKTDVGMDILKYDWGNDLKNATPGAIIKHEWNDDFRLLLFTPNPQYGITTVCSAYMSDIERGAFDTSRKMIIVVVFGTLFIGFGIYFIIERNLAQIRQIQKIIYHLANGEISNNITVISTDELGAISTDINTVIYKLKESVGSIKGLASEISVASDQMTSTTESFTKNAQDQSTSSQEIAATVEELMAGLDSVSDEAVDQFERLTALSGEIDKMVQITKEMESSIGKSMQISEKISSDAHLGDESLKEMNSSMNKIITSSHSMTDIVGIINDISTQINLLSLNAAIEAARAGESGRGFAVVADEISKLADQTASSIKDIEEFINQNNIEIEKGMSNVATSSRTISAIIESISSITGMMSLIGNQMQEQVSLSLKVDNETDKVKSNSEAIKTSTIDHKNSITEIVKAITFISELTQSNATGSVEMAANSRTLSTRAEELAHAVEFFKL